MGLTPEAQRKLEAVVRRRAWAIHNEPAFTGLVSEWRLRRQARAGSRPARMIIEELERLGSL